MSNPTLLVLERSPRVAGPHLDRPVPRADAVHGLTRVARLDASDREEPGEAEATARRERRVPVRDVDGAGPEAPRLARAGARIDERRPRRRHRDPHPSPRRRPGLAADGAVDVDAAPHARAIR